MSTQKSKKIAKKSKKKVSHNRSFADVDALIEAMQRQIAALQEENAALREGGAYKSNSSSSHSSKTSHSPHATSHSPRSSVLATPTLQSFNAVGPTTLRVAWNAVPNAGGYVIKTATNNLLTTDVRTFDVGASATFTVLSGFTPNTRYFVQIMAKGDGVEFTDSNWSTYKNTETWQLGESGGGGGGDDTVSQLQNWLSELKIANQNLFAVIPDLEGETLSPADRRRKLGSGVRRYGYFDKISDVAMDYPQFWPLGSNESENLKDLIREIEVYRNLLVFFESGVRLVTDKLLLLGTEAFRLANVYYVSVHAAARRQLDPEAEAVFRRIREFWDRPRQTSSTTEKKLTKKQALRDAKAIMDGTKVGKMTLENKPDTFIPGKKRITDDAMPKRYYTEDRTENTFEEEECDPE